MNIPDAIILFKSIAGRRFLVSELAPDEIKHEI